MHLKVLDALPSLGSVMPLTEGYTIFQIADYRLQITDYNLTTLQLYNITTLQLYNLTTLQPYNLTPLKPKI